ncbi:MAG: DNA-protecting protein DprA [Planctomycetes bacterium]|nr:DNA-protecting protein DprA [Planctomycetota bacterium]
MAGDAQTHIVCWEDPNYPAQLRYCDDPPVCLYVRGDLQPTDAVSIAIVGSRKSSRYGYDQARRFATLLAGAGFTVVSGMARGVDGYAHDGALCGNGRTVAVLGSGVDVIYPPEHGELAKRIIGAGAIISELPMRTQPAGGSFPRRNRIIAGMTLGTLVVEASSRSGALITARLASEYNREVFAVPGQVNTPTAIGTNRLIQKGEAKLVAGLEDILDELGDVGKKMGSTKARSGDTPDSPDATRKAIRASLDANERALVDLLGDEELTIDDLIAQSGLQAAAVTASLTTLQIKGAIVIMPGNRIARRRSS